MPYSFDGRIRYSEVDERQTLTLPALVDYFQDCSSFQSEDMSIGLDFLNSRHIAWMIVYWQIEIGRLPHLGEYVKTQTWPYAFKGFYGLRNFRMLDAQGNALAWANSVWVQMDTQQLKPVRVDSRLLEVYRAEPKLEMEYLPRKIHIPEQMEDQEEILVSRQHLDPNHHVNNGQFFRMAQEFLPDDFSVGRICVEYMNQAHLDDRILVRTGMDKDSQVVVLDQPGGDPYCVVRFDHRENVFPGCFAPAAQIN